MLINNPTVLVGLPRSGSTLLTAILNQSPSHYILNDLYYLQFVDGRRAWRGFANGEDAAQAKLFLRNMVRHRAAVFSPKGIANSAEMSARELEQALAAIDDLDLEDGGPQWASTLENVISAAAKVLAKSGWGWNTPQDYHHADRIISQWPNARIIFLMRDPRSTLKSYKFYPKRPAAHRYHPVAQSMAWRNAARSWEIYSQKYPKNMLLVRYEDIVNNTKNEISRINAFLPASIDENLDLASLGSNSSYSDGQQAVTPRKLDPLELWLSDSVLYRERISLGFDYPSTAFSLSGIASLLRTNMRFAGHYGREALLSPDTRRRIIRLLKPAR